MSDDEWTLAWEDYDPADEGLRETLATLGNGRFATRGALCETRADEKHYPGTYLAGGYNRAITQIAGRDIENEDLVNWPNWLLCEITVDGAALVPTSDAVQEHKVTLNLRAGLLTRRTLYRAPGGKTLELREERLVSMANPHIAALRLSLTPIGGSADITVRSLVDGSVINWGVPRYRALNGEHIKVTRTAIDGDVAVLNSRTLQSGVEATTALRTTSSHPARDVVEDKRVGHEVSASLAVGGTLSVVKTIAFVTERDPAIASPELTAVERVAAAGDFDVIADAHAAAMATLWDDFDISLHDGTSNAQTSLRVHLFHLIQTLSPHTAEMDVGAPARGWHGEAYRGHIFWDELFIFRVLNLRAPRLVEALLRYRYRRLDAARQLAREAGLPGAMYPWQSSSDGREETQRVHLNPNSGRWIADETDKQRHVGLAIAYNVWNYFRATNNLDFMVDVGAEMLAEIARLFAALTTFNPQTGRYHMAGVMGPDEFHTAYPGRDGGGINDNAYTNVLTAWTMLRAVDGLENLPAGRAKRLRQRMGITEEELQHWLDISERMYVPVMPNGLIAQFDGYGELEELDWDSYRQEYGDIHRLDRILEAEGKSPNDYKLSKQADVLMLPFLFSAEALTQLFEQLGYDFRATDIPKLVEYYDKRTSHGSTLSTIVHAWVVARTDRARSWSLFCDALGSDIHDVQGGTTREGIHLGAMCGTIDMVQACYLGCEARGDALHVDPVLPDALSRVATRIHYRGQDIEIRATRETVTLTNSGGTGETVWVVYRGRQRRLPPAGRTEFRMMRSQTALENGDMS